MFYNLDNHIIINLIQKLFKILYNIYLQIYDLDHSIDNSWVRNLQNVSFRFAVFIRLEIIYRVCYSEGFEIFFMKF